MSLQEKTGEPYTIVQDCLGQVQIICSTQKTDPVSCTSEVFVACFLRPCNAAMFDGSAVLANLLRQPFM